MKSHKRGYTLATTLLIMVFVFSISAVMVSLVAGQSKLGKQNAQNFEQKLAVMQICTNFVNMSKPQFDAHYQNLGFAPSVQGTKTTWFTNENPLSIVLDENAGTENLWVVDYKKSVSLANVQKTNGLLVKYFCEEKEFEL